MDGLVYFAICSSCGSEAAARGRAAGTTPPTRCERAHGKRVWRIRDGKYASPIVADEDRVYLTGRVATCTRCEASAASSARDSAPPVSGQTR